jgi:hypothetical protein
VFELELVDWCLDSCDNRSCPGNATRIGRHVLWDWWLLLVGFEQLLLNLEFFQVLNKNFLILVVKLLLDLGTSVDILELAEKFEGTVR